MGSKKRDHSSREETKEERRARKRQMKEGKKQKKEAKKREREAQTQEEAPHPHNDNPPTEDRNSGLLTSKKIRLQASILPAGLADVKTSLNHCLQEFLLRYSDSVDGVIMAYSYNNIEILNNGKGRTVEELPHLHYDLACDALVFTPIPNAKLKGRVTGSFHSHISLVVFNYFNASISADHLRTSGFEYDVSTEVWYDSESEHALQKGSFIHFAIEKVHEADGMISIDGCNPRMEL